MSHRGVETACNLFLDLLTLNVNVLMAIVYTLSFAITLNALSSLILIATEAFSCDSLMFITWSGLVLPMECLVCSSMADAIVIHKGITISR